MIRAPHTVLLVAAAVACLCKPSPSLFTGPRPITSQPESVNTRPVTADLVKIREALGIALVNDMYLDRPYISPETAQPCGNPDGVGRPAFSHVHSIFEAGQKGPLLGRPGFWIRQTNATMVLSFHDGCPLQVSAASVNR
ncbi:uncharacterized protein LOC122393886 [Amphibalanus amphitrite]|uniref:uncharacterized protein LOC122393886 n=1 Tax=Amphibalanus amphitrite TaxID=1232801 RepID=UPI001C90A6B5|nr:uncharacterized protein LOC122393886 [Amphibalanus amphitrite]